MNGIRQPHALNASSPLAARTIRITASERKRAKRRYRKADREGGESFQEARRRVVARKKLCRDDCREAAEDIEVVPFDHGANGGCRDHLPDATRIDCGMSERTRGRSRD